MIPNEVYRQRRKRLMGLIGSGLIIIPPTPELIYSNDKHVRYRQNSNLIYLSGIKQKESVLILDAAQHKTFLFILSRNDQLEQWYGARMDREEAGNISGVELVYTKEELEIKIHDLVKNISKIYLDRGINPDMDRMIEETIKDTEKLVVPLNERIDTLRLIKDEHEIELIERSVEISINAHIEAISHTEPGMKEYEIEAIYANHFRINGAILPTYQASVASGENAIILHHHANHSELKNDDLLLVDCGAEYQYYTSDLARTWPISGKFTNEQKQLYKLILKVQQDCIDMVSPGVKFWDIHHFAKIELTKGLIDLGILKGSVEKNMEENQIDLYFMHGIGHFLGIDTHDSNSVDRTKTVLQAGMYLTIEPGLYFPDKENIPEAYRGIGIRIEDNILVTKGGSRNLSISLPKSVDEIEELVGSALNG